MAPLLNRIPPHVLGSLVYNVITIYKSICYELFSRRAGEGSPGRLSWGLLGTDFCLRGWLGRNGNEEAGDKAMPWT